MQLTGPGEPEPGGLYLLGRQRTARPALRDVPVVLLTSLADPLDVVRGLAAGADETVVLSGGSFQNLRLFPTLTVREKAAQMVWQSTFGDYVAADAAQWRRLEANITEDRIGGVLMTQLLPFFDMPVIETLMGFEIFKPAHAGGWFQDNALVMMAPSGWLISCDRAAAIKPKLLTREAFLNAIRVNSAIGGSTNAPIHLNAIARHIGVELSLADWEEHGSDIPLVVNLQPAGKYLGEDFYRAGGVPERALETARRDGRFEILRSRGCPEFVIRAILSHGEHTNTPRESPLEHVVRVQPRHDLLPVVFAESAIPELRHRPRLQDHVPGLDGLRASVTGSSAARR